MGTRSIWTFKDTFQTPPVHVYVHYDGYPTGAAGYLEKTLESGRVWPLPRYEADEFAAGFVAAIKSGGGNVRIANRRAAQADVAYGYTVFNKGEVLRITVSETDFWGARPKEKKLWEGPVHELRTWAEEHESRYA